MSKRVSINIGFITNSSSVVHHFPRRLLETPKIAAFLKTFEVEGGFVGPALWSRSHCTTVAITTEQKSQVHQSLLGSRPEVRVDSDELVVIYGDEYSSIATYLCDLLVQALINETGCDPEDSLLHGVEFN